jgi:cation diffusion facilitator CzcD-associated flavoprotein CzcO
MQRLATRRTEVVIVGAGLGGLAAGHELRERGIDDFVILDKGKRIGGVWRENRYPNVACDTPIELYAFSFHQGTNWSQNFAAGSEILAYLEEIARRYDLERSIVLETDVASAQWDDDAQEWTVVAADGRTWTSRFLIWAGGLLSQPRIPTFPGADTFRGPVVHTAQWRDDVDLTGKNVAVVGGGASSIQVLPYAAKHAKHVYAFIRTPSHVLPKPERTYADEDRRRFATGSSMQRDIRAQLSDESEDIARARFPMNDAFIESIEMKWRAFMEAEIRDPQLREVLTPRYRFSCRRPLVSNAYYPVFNQPNVTAVGAGLEALTPRTAVAGDGRAFEVDAVILATGYDAAGMLGRFHVIGRDGHDLAQAWKAYPEAYLGTLVKGFPNLFLVNGPNLGAPAVTEIVEAQTKYVAACIRYVETHDVGSIEVKPQIHDDFNRDLQARFAESVLLRGGCTSWYRAGGGTGAVFSHWPATIGAYKDCVASPRSEEFVITPRTVAT